jgi:hypothetical protein
MNNKFKLEYYFAIYKDKPFRNRDVFRENFRKKHGDFKYLNELIEKIEKYQVKKYGRCLVYDCDYLYRSKDECKRRARIEHQRDYQRRKKNENSSK